MGNTTNGGFCWTEFLGLYITLKYLHNFKTRSKVILEPRVPSPQCSGKFQLMRSWGHWQSPKSAPSWSLQIPQKRGQAAGQKATGRRGHFWWSGPRDTVASMDHTALSATRAASPSNAPNVRPPTWWRWASGGPLLAPASPAWSCRQHRGSEAKAPAHRCSWARLSRPEVLRELFPSVLPSAARSPPPAAGSGGLRKQRLGLRPQGWAPLCRVPWGSETTMLTC